MTENMEDKKNNIKIKKSYEPRTAVGITTWGVQQEVYKEDIDNPTLLKLYKQVDVIRDCIEAVTYGVTNGGFHYEPRFGSTIDEYQKSVLDRFFFEPNENDTIDDLIIDSCMDLLLFGEGYWQPIIKPNLVLKFYQMIDSRTDVRRLNIPFYLYKLSAYFVSPTATQQGIITGFLQKNNFGIPIITFNKDELIFFKMPSPVSDVRGHSPVANRDNTLASYLFADEYNGRFFYNNATPRLHIDLGKVSAKEMMAFTGQAEKELKGKPHRNLVTRGGVIVTPISLKNSDMEFNTYIKMLRARIMGFYKVPPIMLGILDDSKSLNADYQIEIFKFLAVNPVQKIIENRINRRLIPRLFPNFDLQFKFNPVNDLDLINQSKIDGSDLKDGIKVINEIRKSRGMKPVDWGNKPILPFSDASKAILNVDGSGQPVPFPNQIINQSDKKIDNIKLQTKDEKNGQQANEQVNG